MLVAWQDVSDLMSWRAGCVLISSLTLWMLVAWQWVSDQVSGFVLVMDGSVSTALTGTLYFWSIARGMYVILGFCDPHLCSFGLHITSKLLCDSM
ncbi:hypothetical protein EDD15DRAFT_2304180 [Pisolithus albus]|nr:hypothetical protein EDD15DRAFT_2304180 [Pisolithus albus]